MPGVYSVGTGALGDALLISHLASGALDTAVTELLVRADDPHLSSIDRGDYLAAASNLAPHLDEPQRSEHFPIAVRLAVSPTPSEHDEMNQQFTHKLGGLRMNGMPQHSRGQALALAATLASTDAEREEVRRVVYSLLGEDADYWPTIALQRLGDTVDDDLTFLAVQGWAIRSFVALRWAEHGKPEHLGLKLARDPDARVRRALAGALALRADGTRAEAREILAADPAYSVRSALKETTAP